jgi:hypothetical protein
MVQREDSSEVLELVGRDLLLFKEAHFFPEELFVVGAKDLQAALKIVKFYG